MNNLNQAGRKQLKALFFLFILIFLGGNCMGQLLNLPREYKLIDGYIYAANSESTRLECPNCDQENQIYRINKEFIYSYKYVDVNQKAFRFKLLENGNWEFVDATSNGSNVIIDVALLVLPDGEHFKKSSYCQTKIGFKLLENQCNHPTTGLIENQKNIWLHPPRELLFKVLELNPFPYIKAPFQIGTEWKWELNIGPQWADKRWRIWTNEIHNNYRYKITATTLLKTKLGILKCFVIDGVAKSELGETLLRSYFNEVFGFVKLEYKNIDNSILEFEIKRVDDTSLLKSLMPTKFK